MYADPIVVRRKVERELKEFVERIDHFRSRGIWVLEYSFPELLVAFVAAKVKPYPVAPYGVLLDLSNYDVEPPSIRFVNPFTRAPLKGGEIPTRLVRLRTIADTQTPEGAAAVQEQANPAQGVQVHPDALLQWWSEADDRPFVCLQGVREYHENPGHTGDPWWSHRAVGAGRIVRLLELISRYGTESMVALQINVQVQIQAIQSQTSIEPA